MSIITDIINARVFVGCPKKTSNPKTRAYRSGVHSGTVIFDVDAIEEQLKVAKSKIQEAKKTGKDILVICEKSLYKDEIEVLAEKAGFHFLNHKVPSGVLTNFDTMLSRVKSLRDLRAYVESDAFVSLTKKEQSMKKRELKKIEKVYKGVVSLKRKPGLVVIVDGQYMHKFIAEVDKLKSDGIVLASSDFDKIIDQHLVTCNVNSNRSLDFVLKYMFG